jgi:hypothetical protein
VLAGSLVLAGLLAGQTTQTRVTRAADLPVFTYPVEGSVEDLVKNEKAFRAFATQARKNIESVPGRLRNC